MRTRNWLFTSLTLLIFLFYHSLLKLYYVKQIEGLSGLGRSSRQSGGKDGFAYVFYATADLYACSTLVNIQRLRSLNSTVPIHVLASEFLSIPYMGALQGAGVTVHVEKTPSAHFLAGGYYEDCLLKLLAFKLHKLDPSLRRVLVIDSDQLVLRHLDSLFSDLPRVDLAAPRAYWLPSAEAGMFSSAFMIINLSDRLWDKVNRSLLPIGDDWPPGAPRGTDMDTLNQEFGDTAMVLRGEYVTLNSQWEDWVLPNWFHPEDAPPPGGRALMQQDISTMTTTTTTRFPEDSEIFQQLVQLHEYASIIHFSALGKPWTYSVQEVMRERPDAHPLFAHQFGMWRKVAGEVCPEDWKVK